MRGWKSPHVIALAEDERNVRNRVASSPPCSVISGAKRQNGLARRCEQSLSEVARMVGMGRRIV